MMEYMESKIQDQYDGFDAEIEALDPFINDLLEICKKHNIDNSGLSFVTGLFTCGYMPPLAQTGNKNPAP